MVEKGLGSPRRAASSTATSSGRDKNTSPSASTPLPPGTDSTVSRVTHTQAARSHMGIPKLSCVTRKEHVTAADDIERLLPFREVFTSRGTLGGIVVGYTGCRDSNRSTGGLQDGWDVQ